MKRAWVPLLEMLSEDRCSAAGGRGRVLRTGWLVAGQGQTGAGGRWAQRADRHDGMFRLESAWW